MKLIFERSSQISSRRSSCPEEFNSKLFFVFPSSPFVHNSSTSQSRFAIFGIPPELKSFLKDSIKVEEGFAYLPNLPGLGIDLDWDFIDNTTFKKI